MRLAFLSLRSSQRTSLTLISQRVCLVLKWRNLSLRADWWREFLPQSHHSHSHSMITVFPLYKASWQTSGANSNSFFGFIETKISFKFFRQQNPVWIVSFLPSDEHKQLMWTLWYPINGNQSEWNLKRTPWRIEFESLSQLHNLASTRILIQTMWEYMELFQLVHPVSLFSFPSSMSSRDLEDLLSFNPTSYSSLIMFKIRVNWEHKGNIRGL